MKEKVAEIISNMEFVSTTVAHVDGQTELALKSKRRCDEARLLAEVFESLSERDGEAARKLFRIIAIQQDRMAELLAECKMSAEARQAIAERVRYIE